MLRRKLPRRTEARQQEETKKRVYITNLRTTVGLPHLDLKLRPMQLRRVGSHAGPQSQEQVKALDGL